jgi:hypothetical protein
MHVQFICGCPVLDSVDRTMNNLLNVHTESRIPFVAKTVQNPLTQDIIRIAVARDCYTDTAVDEKTDDSGDRSAEKHDA